MTQAPLPAHALVAAELQSLEASLDASELHGSLCGYLSGGGAHERKGWFAAVMSDALLSPVEPDSALDQLYLASTGQLESPDFGFELLLPAEDRPVEERGDGLLAWCRGFLGGFGLASGANPPLSEESEEALADMARIAASDLTYEEPEADAEALEEVTEFIRVAALLLHSDCVLGPRHRRKLN
ncbi:UPF0149 family protein [Arenimonas donghaensis]|uniref:YecA family protein n=1 Tax=Arenimonas donghaensis DSM 18148 = HO3-R19 TaxID=1121014 RepID=A0A087MGG7_9GAMM|nr:UPF0149 family protein [Arenimonas donghaensis]KFL35970.1 hypothetical protein N788_06755 [Arenimonas donghaensis DSM 18148 = HO3-R19]